MKRFLSTLFRGRFQAGQQPRGRFSLSLETLERRDLPSTYLSLVNVPGFNPATGAQNYDQINFTYNGQSLTDAGVQLGVAVSSSPTIAAGTPPTFYGYCVDLLHPINLNQPYQVRPTSAVSALPNGAALAYLYDTFNPEVSSLQVGTSAYKNAAAALQLAIWEKEFGSAFHLSSVKDFGNNSADVTGAVAALAATYLNSIPSNPGEQATYYDATLGGIVNNSEQGVIGPPGVVPGIRLVKLTNGVNDPNPNGSNVVQIAPGATVTWTYLVTNTGNVPFPRAVIQVTDNQPGVNPAPKLGANGFIVGDNNDNNILDPGETWTYIATGTALNLSNPPPAGVTTVPLNGGYIDTTLGPAANYAALALASTRIQLSSGPLNFTGNVGVGNSGELDFSAGTVKGLIDLGTGARNNISGGATATGGVVNLDMTPVTNAALSASTTFAALTPTQTINSNITSSQMFTGSGGRNVIDVNGLVHLSGGTLTLSGGPNDQFIFNITGGFQFDGGASIVLSGINASQVVFNFPGSGDQIQFSSGSYNTYGIFLAPNRVIQVNGGTHHSEFISGVNLSFQSNPVVTQPPGPPHVYENTGKVAILNTNLIATYLSTYRNPATPTSPLLSAPKIDAAPVGSTGPAGAEPTTSTPASPLGEVAPGRAPGAELGDLRAIGHRPGSWWSV
jgi:hypothetical protein